MSLSLLLLLLLLLLLMLFLLWFLLLLLLLLLVLLLNKQVGWSQQMAEVSSGNAVTVVQPRFIYTHF